MSDTLRVLIALWGLAFAVTAVMGWMFLEHDLREMRNPRGWRPTRREVRTHILILASSPIAIVVWPLWAAWEVLRLPFDVWDEVRR